MAFGDVERLRLLDTAKDKPFRFGEISFGVDSIVVFFLFNAVGYASLSPVFWLTENGDNNKEFCAFL